MTTTKAKKQTIAAKAPEPTKIEKQPEIEIKTNLPHVAGPMMAVKGSYEFLIEHFREPSTIIDAATALASHSKIDAQIAVKKIEQFFENARIDKTLEVRAGTGDNEGQFLIARVPQGAQRKYGGGGVKKTTKKKTTKKKTTTEKKISRRGLLVQMLRHKSTTIKDLIAGLRGLYTSDIPEAKIQQDIRWYLSNADRLGGKLTKTEGKHGETQYALQ